MPRRRKSGLEHAPISEIKAELFKALGHPTRVRVLEVLADGPHSVGELQPLVGVELPNLSQQLAVLRHAGVVTTRREGSSVIYAIRDPEVVTLLEVSKRVLINALSEGQDLLADLRTTGAR